MENLCGRLGLKSLTYLWNRDQHALLREMIKFGVEAKVVKTAAKGTGPTTCINTIESLEYYFSTLNEKYGFNICGEGGEYETVVTDCPLFTHGKISHKAAGISGSISNNQSVSHGYFGLDPGMKDHGSSLIVVSKSNEEEAAHKTLMTELMDRRANATHEFLHCNPPALSQRIEMQKALRKSGSGGKDLSEMLEPRITLSVSILDPSLTSEQIKAIPQKDQMIRILDYAKS